MSVLEQPARVTASPLTRRDAAPFPWDLGLLGLLATTGLVLAAGRSTMPLGVVVEPSFGGLLDPAPSGGTVSSIVVLLSLATMVVCWWRVLERTGAAGLGVRSVAGVGLLWALPVLLAPPLLSLDAFAYLAQGHMLSVGLDPYAGGPVLLGQDPVGARVDPMWRANGAPYGPVALVLFRLVAAAGGDLSGGVLLLRLLAGAGVLAAIAVAVHLSRPERRARVLALGLLNPLTLAHLIGGVHVDAILAGVVAASLLALRYRRTTVALLLAGVSVSIKVTALPLLPFVLVVMRKRGASWPGVVIAGLTALLAPFALTRPLVPRPWAFIEALAGPGSAHVWYSPATLLGNAVDVLAVGVGGNLSAGVAMTAGTVLALLAGSVAILFLLRAQWRSDEPEPGELDGAVLRAAAAVLLAALCLPALYPWYLAAGLLVLAAAPGRGPQRIIVFLSSALAFAALPPLRSAAWLPLILTSFVVLLVLSMRSRGAMRRPVPVLRELRWLWTAPHPRVHLPRRRQLKRPRRGYEVAGIAVLAGSMLALGGVSAASSPPDAAPPTALQERAPERSLLVQQLQQHFPDHHIVSLTPAGTGTYDVELVEPGVARCELVLRRAVGPGAGWLRLPSPDHGTLRADDELACPPADPA